MIWFLGIKSALLFVGFSSKILTYILQIKRMVYCFHEKGLGVWGDRPSRTWPRVSGARGFPVHREARELKLGPVQLYVWLLCHRVAQSC